MILVTIVIYTLTIEIYTLALLKFNIVVNRPTFTVTGERFCPFLSQWRELPFEPILSEDQID